MNIFYWVCALDIGLFIGFYLLGAYAVKKESRDTWGDAKTMEMTKSNNLSKEWVKKHPILDFFQEFHYEVQRKLELPGETYRAIKWFIQRGKRGYSDCDVWGFDYYLTEVLIGGLKQLKNNMHGCPSGIVGTQGIPLKENSKAMWLWKKTIRDIIWTFETANKILEHKWMYVPLKKARDKKSLETFAKKTKTHIMTKEECDKYKKGWKLFQIYYFDLWD